MSAPILKKLKRINQKQISNSLLVECAWEVVNQIGGIYTVVRSKAPNILKKWGDSYCLLGPYVTKAANSEFEPAEDYDTPFGRAVLKMNDLGYKVHYGTWLVSGRPQVVLFDLHSVMDQLGKVKYLLWDHHGIKINDYDPLVGDVIAFGEMTRIFIGCLVAVNADKNIITHFHEWMAGSCIPQLRKEGVKIKIIFTTHATMLGRCLAMNDPNFYDRLEYIDWHKETVHFNIESQIGLERAAAHGAHVFTTVSDVTAMECRHLLGRDPEILLPNGINYKRFEALHEFQNLHLEYKNKIHEFTMAHFFSSYTFDLDKTIYLFTSGRYEYRNKGYDLCLEALSRLNSRLKTENSDVTVVMFFITKRPYSNVNPRILETRALLEEFRFTLENIKKQIGNKLFFDSLKTDNNKLPEMRDYVDDYWRLRYRRTLQSWRADKLPPIITHDLVDNGNDQILSYLNHLNLLNYKEDKVKVVYHPDFISYTNPLFSMDYSQFVRGCHMGMFPSYYEPWGYTPLECIARGVPAITSDLAGFGDYVEKNIKEPHLNGLYVIKRNRRNFNDAAGQLANKLYNFVRLSRRERISLRNKVEATAQQFDWQHLSRYYEHAYQQML